MLSACGILVCVGCFIWCEFGLVLVFDFLGWAQDSYCLVVYFLVGGYLVLGWVCV